MASRYAAGPRIPIPRGNIAQLFFGAVDAYDKIDALRWKRGGAWHALSHRRIEESARRLALGLEGLGLERGDRVAILSENRPEWLITDFGCILAELIVVPLYPMLPAAQLEPMLDDSEAKAVFVSNADQLEKVRTLRPRLPALRRIVTYEATRSGAEGRAPLGDGPIEYGTLLSMGRARAERGEGSDYRERALAVDPGAELTLLYTSGTTGRPKGVVLTHDNLVSNVRGVLKVLDIGPDDVSLSYLPLSHIFERMAGHYVMFSRGVTICYAESVDRVAEYMREVRPTVMTSVPRGYEKMYERARESAREDGAFGERIFERAVAVAGEYADRVVAGRSPGPGLRVQRGLADRLVYRKLRDATGGRIRFFVSGGAPLDADLARFFHGAGLPILQGYGLTETSPVITVNTPDDLRFGSVGRPIPNVEVGLADDDEVLTRGPHVMKGYHRDPEATREAIDPDGWFRTGDLGRIDGDGHLHVTGRKKELIKTSGGKFIAPEPIEMRVEQLPWVLQAVVVGENRKFPALLVVPDYGRLMTWARSQGIDRSDPAELAEEPRVRTFLEGEVLGALDDLARFERPKKVALLPGELTIEGGELTPTLKVKRRVVEERFGGIIEALYRSDEESEPAPSDR